MSADDTAKYRLLTYSEIEEIYGINRGTLASYVHLGKAPCIRLGKRCTRFTLKDIDRWIDDKRDSGGFDLSGIKTTRSRLLTYREVEALFGINRSTLANYVAENQIPHIKLGPRHTRFDREEIEAWINSKRVPNLKEEKKQ